MKKRIWGIVALGVLCLLGVVIFCLWPDGTGTMQKFRGRFTVADRVAEYGDGTRERWRPYFAQKGVAYPPQKIVLVGLKREKQLEVYAAGAGQPLRLVRTLPILGASGKIGPKLKYGDYQVPEGFYRIESLNPNSAFHLALRVSYPNELDRAQAEEEGRTDLGGDIMIHGSHASAGCLAMGDEAAEDLFVLAAETGIENIRVILSPVDFRVADVPEDAERPEWVTGLYGEIKSALRRLPTA